MKWENPVIVLNKFDKENIVTASYMSLNEAKEYVDIEGAEGKFLSSWICF